MASTYVNNLRLEEIGSGEQSGTWGDTTNTNLEIIGQAVAWGTRAIADASTDNITIADGALDADRCLGLKLTGGGQACTVTLLPNTSSKTWFMYNATSAALTFTCGSGANVIIPAGQTKVIATDGLGSGGVVHDLLTAVNLAGATVVDDLTVSDDLTVTDDMTVGGTLGVTGVLTGTSLDISGDIDVDGTTNLDVVDIDGAVDMASTLTVAGVLTGASLDISGDIDVDGTSNLDIIDVDGAANFAADVTFADGADIITASAGTSNVRVGVNAGNSIQSGGNYNTVVGDEAGTAITTGDNNTLIGYVAGDAISTSSGNTAVGSFAMTSMTDGSDNVAVGTSALDIDTKGSQSVAVGRNALGSQNFTSAVNAISTAVGYNAGGAVTTGVNNVLIGGFAGDALTGTADYSGGSNNVAVGRAALGADTLGSAAVAIGFEALLAQNFTSTTESYNTAVGYRAGLSVLTGANNTLIGGLSGDAITTGGSNVAVGSEALTSNTTGGVNTAVGTQAAYTNTTGGRLTAVGYQALYSNTTGTNNVAVGSPISGLAGALGTNTEGNYNVAVGDSALANNTTASSNTAVGYATLRLNTTGTGNNSFGYYSLDANTTGNYNTAFGHVALSTNQTGGGNTAFGSQVLYSATGSSNTAVGDTAGYAVTSGSNNIFLGKDAGRTGSPGGNITTASNTLVIGDENISASHIQTDWTVASDQRDKTDFTALDVGLDFVNALKPVTYKWDKRSKYGDKTSDDYDLDNITTDGTHKEDWLDIGFKAQEVEALEKAAGYKIADKTNLTTSLTGDGKQYGIQYAKFVPILVKAIQEQNALIEALTARITTLEG